MNLEFFLLGGSLQVGEMKVKFYWKIVHLVYTGREFQARGKGGEQLFLESREPESGGPSSEELGGRF